MSADDPALLPFTSGTTGAPKGALAVARQPAGVAPRRCGIGVAAGQPTDTLLLCLPLFHVHGLGVGLHGTLLAGASAVILQRGFDAEAVLDAAATERDAVLRRADDVRAARRRAPALARARRLRLCVSGSAPLSRRAARARSASGRARRRSSATA